MDNEEKESLRVKFQASLAEFMEGKNSTLARIFRSNLWDAKTNTEDVHCGPKQICTFCCEVNNGDEFQIRVIPKIRFTNRLRKILRKVIQKVKLSKAEQRWLAAYKKSTTRVATKCVRCGKRQFTKGPNRFLFKQEQCKEKVSQNSVMTKILTPKERAKAKKKKKKKKKRASKSAEASGINVQSVSMEMDSGLDTTIGLPLISSTPKPQSHSSAGLSGSQHGKELLINSEFPKVALWNQSLCNKSTEKKLTNQRLSVPSLLDDSLTMTQPNVKKKKKTKDMHLQLQKMIKKSKKSSGSLKDFLSSV